MIKNISINETKKLYTNYHPNRNPKQRQIYLTLNQTCFLRDPYPQTVVQIQQLFPYRNQDFPFLKVIVL